MIEKLLFYFLLLSFAFGGTLIASLQFRKKFPLANQLLSLIIAGVLYCQFIFYLFYTGEILSCPYLFRSQYPFNLLVISLLYLYTCALTQPKFHLEKKHLWHLLPFCFGLTWYLTIEIFFTHAPMWEFSKAYFFERFCRMCIGLLIAFGYLMQTLKVLYFYQKQIKNVFSQIQEKRLEWLKVLTTLFFSLWLVEFFDAVQGPSVALWHWFIPAATVTIFLLCLFSMRQSILFADQLEPYGIQPKSFIFPEMELSSHVGRLEQYMAENKPYMNPEFRLIDLANGLNLRPAEVSELINRGEKSNFYEFVNRYRVEEVKRRLKDPQYKHMNLLGIATDCGFNSKSVFNETFKKLTGLTPSAFRAA